MNNEDKHSNWSEAQWELEIRRDEGRINRYFHELPVCIDLPGEEEFIFADISSIPELVPGNTTSEEWKKLRRFEDEPEDDCCEHEEQCHDDECIKLLDELTVNWNILCVNTLHPDLWCAGVGITCDFSKLIARIADFNNTDKNGEYALKKALGKRMLKDLNMLTLRLNDLARYQSEITPTIDDFTKDLSRLRQVLQNRLYDVGR